MTPCAECGRDVMFLDDVGCEPTICGYCKKLMCPICEQHSECAPKIDAHNKEVEKRRLKKQIETLTKKLEDLG